MFSVLPHISLQKLFFESSYDSLLGWAYSTTISGAILIAQLFPRLLGNWQRIHWQLIHGQLGMAQASYRAGRCVLGDDVGSEFAGGVCG